MIKSDVADMKNIGIGRAAGTITAAAFLKNAIENTPWVHIGYCRSCMDTSCHKRKTIQSERSYGIWCKINSRLFTKFPKASTL